MDVSNSVVLYLTNTLYNLLACDKSLRRLDGYSDRNFAIVDSLDDSNKFVLKIINEEDSTEELTSIIDEILVNGVDYCNAKGDSLLIKMPRLIRTVSERTSSTCNIRVNYDEEKSCNIKLFQYLEAKTLKESLSICHAKSGQDVWFIFEHLGQVCYELNRFLQTQQHLKNRLKQKRAEFPWQLVTCKEIMIELRDQFFPLRNPEDSKNRHLIDKVLEEWNEKLQPQLGELPDFVLHGDLNIKNIMVDHEQLIAKRTSYKPYWIIDFQDVQVGPRVIDLAIMMLYAVLETSKWIQFQVGIERIPSLIVRGYLGSGYEPLSGRELGLLASLMRFRLCQSMLNGLLAFEHDPGNKKLLSTNVHGWSLLELLFAKDAQLNESFLKQQQQQQEQHQ